MGRELDVGSAAVVGKLICLSGHLFQLANEQTGWMEWTPGHSTWSHLENNSTAQLECSSQLQRHQMHTVIIPESERVTMTEWKQ